MTFQEELDAIEARLTALETKPDTAPVQASTGLFAFARPNQFGSRHGLGSRMDSPDVYEAVQRACSSVNYQGTQILSGGYEDEVWTEIERLKAGDPALREKYRLLDPAFAGFALLTGLLDTSRHDGFNGAAKRDAMAGKTIFSFLSNELAVGGTPGIAGE